MRSARTNRIIPTSESEKYPMCLRCYQWGTNSVLVNGQCLVCGKEPVAIIYQEIRSLDGILSKRSLNRMTTSTSITSVDQQRALSKFQREEIDRRAVEIAASIIVPNNIKDQNERLALAKIAAAMEVQMGVSFALGQGYIAKMGSRVVVILGYRGHEKIASDIDAEQSSPGDIAYHFFSADDEVVWLTPEEIVDQGAHRCRNCGAVGTMPDWDNKKGNYVPRITCPHCKGKKYVDPSQILCCKIKLYRTKVAAQAMKIGLPYFPTEGTGTFDKELDSVPQTWTEKQVCAKRAMTNALRWAYQLTYKKIGDTEVSIMTEDEAARVNDELSSRIYALIRETDLTYDSADALHDLVLAASESRFYDTPDQVMDALSKIGLDFTAAQGDAFRYRLAAYAENNYPVTIDRLAELEEVPETMRHALKADLGADRAEELIAHFGVKWQAAKPYHLAAVLAVVNGIATVEEVKPAVEEGVFLGLTQEAEIEQ